MADGIAGMTRLRGEKTLAAVAIRVFGLKANDRRIATVTEAIARANPHLAGDLAALPEGTPVVVPAVAGIAADHGPSDDPARQALLDLLRSSAISAKTTLDAIRSGRQPTPAPALAASFQRFQAARDAAAPATGDAPAWLPAELSDDDYQKGLETLESDVAAFSKVHGG